MSKFVAATMYEHNNADFIQSRVRRAMYFFNGLLLLFFSLAALRVFGGTVALGSLLFVLIDPTVAAHWPVVMTDLPVALLSVTSLLVCIQALRNWTKTNLCLLALALGLTLSIKHSGLVSFGFIGAFGLAALLWRFRHNARTALRRSAIFLIVLAGAVAIFGARIVSATMSPSSPKGNSIGRSLRKLETSALPFGEPV